VNSRKITLIAVLYMGYLTSGFLKLAFPFIDMPISIIWNGIMMEYLGYSVFFYYFLYMVPFILNTYAGMQEFQTSFFSMINSLVGEGTVPDHPLIIVLIYAILFLDNFVYSWLIHRVFKKSGCFPSFIY